jgi:hypothetical protein
MLDPKDYICTWCGGLDAPELFPSRTQLYSTPCECYECQVCGARGDFAAPVPMCVHVADFRQRLTIHAWLNFQL